MKKLQNGYKGEGVISTKNKIISLVLAIVFLISIPVYAFADDNSNSQTQISDTSYQNTQNGVNRIDNLDLFNQKSNEGKSHFSVEAIDVTNTSATLVWKTEKIYFGYTIKKLNIVLNIWEDVDSTAEQSYTIDNLLPGSQYDYQITSSATGDVLGTVSFTTDSTPVETYVNMGLPNVSGACKTYAYYTAVTLKSSPAYAVLNSGSYNGVDFETYTDPETGIRMVDDCYCAALGSYYGKTMGVKYRITLSTGKQFKIILCDQKSDRHTDSNHQYAVRNQDVVEFYVEKSQIPNNIRGSYNNLDQFNGDIVSIEKIL